MIDIKLTSYQTTDLSTRTKVPLEIDLQLDASLDSGTLNYLITESDGKGLNDALADYQIVVGGTRLNFVGIDSRALLRRGENGQSVYAHQVALTEPSKLLQGAMIDGFGVSQPEDFESRQTLLDVLDRLLEIASLDGQTYYLGGETEAYAMLSEVKSPQFKWNTQTTLWECLVQIGAVIDAMPRLVNTFATGINYEVTFDFVNADVGEVDSIDDSSSNAYGENIEESQYNTALSSIVENLRENE